MSGKILIVDDDPNLLAGIRRQLHRRVEVVTKESPELGLEAVRREGPFAVVISDQRMPNQCGIEFLQQVQKVSPDTVRIMLTGNADLQTAMSAVNDGHIFRFLSKPCSAPVLMAAIEAGIAQYRLITAERQLLSQTLTSSVKVLVDVLALTNPEAFGRASRVRRLMRQMTEKLKPENTWECEMGALLSQVGCVTLSAAVLSKMAKSEPLTVDEQRLLVSHPQAGHDLIVGIPRLAGVAKIVLYQKKRFDGGGFPVDEVAGHAIPLGARLLTICLEFDSLIHKGLRHRLAWRELKERDGVFDPQLLDVLFHLVEHEPDVKEELVDVLHLPIGAMLLEDIVSTDGTILVTSGQEVTETIHHRLMVYRNSKTVREPIRIAPPTHLPPCSAIDGKARAAESSLAGH